MGKAATAVWFSILRNINPPVRRVCGALCLNMRSDERFVVPMQWFDLDRWIPLSISCSLLA
jgi:hypothetical protein